MPIRPILAALAFYFFSGSAFADSRFEAIQYNQKTIIDKTGTRFKTWTMEYLVKTEAGRIFFSNFRIGFQGAPEDFRINELYSSFNGVKTATDLKQVRISEVQSDQTGMGDSKLASTPLSNVQIGSLVRIAYTIKYTPAISGYSNEVLPLSTSDLGKNESYEYESTLPLQILPINFEEFFTIEKSVRNQKFFVKISPTAKAFAQNPKQPAMAFAYLSTMSSWETLNKLMGAEYRKVWQSTLPPELESIVQEVKKIQIVKDKVEFAARKVHSLIAYSGNWVSRQGQMYPQNFSNLVKTKRGDCKDYSTALAAVLNKAGVQAYPALTWRAEQFNIPEQMKNLSVLPSTDLFNHIIVWAKDPATSKTWWVDATNPYINVDVTSRDLLSGYALILDEQQKSLSFLPEQNLIPVETTLTQVVKLNGPLMEGQGHLQLNTTSYNEFAQYETLVGESAAKKFTSYILGANLNLQVNVSKKVQPNQQLAEYNFGYVGPTYLVEDVEKNKWIKFPNYSVDLLKAIKVRQMNYLGELGRFVKVTSFDGLQTVDEYTADCTVRTKWLDYDRMVENSNGRIVVTETTKYKKRFMTAAESDMSVIRMNLSDFYDCANKSLITVNINAKSKTEHDVKRETALGPSVYKMTSSDIKDLERKNVDTSLVMDKFNKLLKVYNLALKKAPSDPEIYLQKARAFMAMSHLGDEKYDENYLREVVDLLVRAQNLKKQYSQEIYTMLFRAHLYLKNYDLAAVYYRSLCTETKSTFLAHSLGADLEEARGNLVEAEKHILQFAAFKFPADKDYPFYEPQLARIYFKEKKFEQAEKIYLKINGFSPASVDTALFLSRIYLEQKEYDKIIALATKQTESKARFQVPVSILSDAHYFKILKKYGLRQTADGSISGEEFKKISNMPNLIEKDLADIVQMDSRNAKPIQLLIKLNTYLYETKQQPVFASKVEYYTAMLNKSGVRPAASSEVKREISSVSKEDAPAK